MLYDSVTITGTASMVVGEAERRHGFETILHQVGYEGLPLEDSPRAAILRVQVEAITAKTHR
jgi:nitroimidazol reductase NimA-like FMN-containing flavoprotein (pyridoxamine 5'-phosphate oxidase superfamily)